MEHVREKTNNLDSEQVRHKLCCTVTENGSMLEILDLESRGIVTNHVAKTNALIGRYCEVDLRACFRLCRLWVFPCRGTVVFSVART